MNTIVFYNLLTCKSLHTKKLDDKYSDYFSELNAIIALNTFFITIESIDRLHWKYAEESIAFIYSFW